MEPYFLNFNRAIDRWDEALPLGNGWIGCLLWGNGAPLRFSLDRADLWDLRPAPETLSEDFTYERLIAHVRDGDQEAIMRNMPADGGRPGSKRRSFITSMRIRSDFSPGRLFLLHKRI
ncbi:hypothetical protein [Paenibacillus sp. J2TS4]|uniref:hypothetical protein n=1 Tax=Paenibacillus sp. J2TS4 TaxID=2807194 RepID=UPI001BCEF811|nr:hypothetical protein [Paenibacillus sp. J2TS4]